MVLGVSDSSVKCIPFKLSRVRFVLEPELQKEQIVVTGSWMEKVNRVCLWRYDCDHLVESVLFRPNSEQEDGTSAGVLGDSADEPRLMHSVTHLGWVQDLQVHCPSQTVFSVSSLGTLQTFRVDTSQSIHLVRLTSSSWSPFSSLHTPSNLPVALASLAVSRDGDRVYVGDDLGRLAAIQVDRIPPCSVDASEEKKIQVPTHTSSTLIQMGADIASLNALETVDQNTLASVNQLGQLKAWDMRCGFEKPQLRLLRPGETQPLYCLSCHPGQPHLLAAGGVEGFGAAAYIWDMRAKQYPLTEVACKGRSVWETKFHPRQPKHLYLATETSGLLRISCRNDNDDWIGFKGSRRKLVVSSALSGSVPFQNTISFDLTNTQIVCGHSDSTIHTASCEVSVY